MGTEKNQKEMNGIEYFFTLEAKNFDIGSGLIGRLLDFGTAPYLSWAVRRLVKDDVVNTLNVLADLYPEDLSVHILRYVYYSFKQDSLSELEKKESYAPVREVIETQYPYPKFWDSILPYNYQHAVRLAVELLVEQGMKPAAIQEKLQISRSVLYSARRKFLNKLLDEKGNDPT